MRLFAQQPPVLARDAKGYPPARLGLPGAPEHDQLLVCGQMIRAMKGANTAEALIQILQDRYHWYSKKACAEAEQCLKGAYLAYQLKLPYQIRNYTEKLIEVYSKDMAARTSALVSALPGSTTFWHYEPNYNFVYRDRFTIPIETRSWGRSLEWVVCPLVEFPNLIPVHALRAIVTLAKAGIVPNGFWVADKVEVVRPRISLDPILCCNFDRWFVGLAQWE